ncbi:1-aminocyclopropane-1-carboxylate deaminase/D-cysteine desulfhydrase [Parapedobacter sp. DT-150]|uniref:1-aminocyclopropane-1-carboxylate deaminase/D-cysteine desulfhydrase n=1 Tax=Parapedobacter sp. DT-150 TaxID=3396162 RepID=UPI003F1CABAC
MLPFDFHSPIEPLDFPLFREKSITVHIKRDDMIHPFISGNKWRKLKYILQKAYDDGKKHLITFGGPWSNHLLATACAGARFGFKTTAFVRGEAVSNPLLTLCKVFGMELRYADRRAYRDKPALFEQSFGGAQDAYFVDEGGYSVEGANGCAEIFEDLDQPYDHLFCACGTGTTLAGLAAGSRQRGGSTKIHGVPILAGGEFLSAAIAGLYPDDAPPDVILHTDYHFGGYAKTTPELLAFIKQFSANTGILLEPVYTGKVFYGLFDLAQRDYFNAGDRILVLHTGGLTGILGMYERFG